MPDKLNTLFDTDSPASFIYSKPIRSGKTTALMNILQNCKQVTGILSPDVDGERHIFDLERKAYIPFQVSDDEEIEEPMLQIGRFRFYESAFRKARDILGDGLTSHAKLIVIDEVGPLELQHKGFEPAVSKLVQAQKTGELAANLLLVVRDSLLDQVIRHYGIDDYHSVLF